MPFLRRSPEPASPAHLRVLVAGEPVDIALRRSDRARRMTLRIKPGSGDVVLTLPRRADLALARRFAERQTDWLETRLRRVQARIPFTPGALVPLRGVPHRVLSLGGRSLTRTGLDETGAPVILVGGALEHCARRLTDFLKREARKDFEAAVAQHAAALGVSIARVQVKDTTSRWGSCSSSGALAFSWRLILAPPPVLDYLAAHEVAHRREMNHGAAFWRHTRALAPHTDEAEAWLKANGAGLHRYGGAA